MNITRLLTQTVTYKAPTSTVNNYGDPTLGSAATASARVERKRSVNLGESNTREVRDVVVTVVEIPKGSRVWLPGADTGDDNASKLVVESVQAQTPNGYVIYEAYL